MATTEHAGVTTVAGDDDIEAAPTEAAPGRRLGHPALVETALVLVLPLVLYVVLQVEPFFIQNGIDSFIYVGYTENIGDLVDRFGYPYYAVRFGLILPGRLLYGLFGATAGHFVLRYLLAVLAAGSVYLLARRLGSRAAGWFAAVLCLSSPVFLRALMTTYSDTTGVPFLLAGVACLLMPSPRRYLWAIASGLLLGLAVHSNPIIAPLLIVILGARFVVQLLRREWRCVLDYAIAGAGILVVTAAGIGYYRVAFGNGDILRPSIRASQQLTGTATSVFQAPTRDWLGFSPHLYLPLLMIVALVGVILTRRAVEGRTWFRSVLEPPVADVLVMLAVAQLVFLQQQFMARRYILETYYYASYLFPFVVLGAVGLMTELAGRKRFGARGVWIATGVLVALPMARNLLFDGLELWVWPTVPIMVVVLAVAFLVGRWRPAALVAGGVILAGSLVLLAIAPPRGLPPAVGSYVRQDPQYHLAVGNSSDEGLEYLDMATQLIDALPRWDDDPGSMVFWYPSSRLIDSMQSTYLWRGGALHVFGDPMPSLNDQQRQMLLERTPRHLVLMAETPEQLAEGRQAILDLGLLPVEVVEDTIRSGDLTVYVQRLTFDPAACDRTWSPNSPFLPAWLELGPC